MEWSDLFDDSRNEIIEYEVLEGLKPSDKLKSLKILYYMGMKFPSWVGDASFGCLTQLTLRGCKNCTCLPTLGHLRSLQKLFVESMSGLKILGSDLLGHSNSFCHGIAFPSLELLEFKDMQGWEIWSTNDGGKYGTARFFPCLRKICIRNCPKLAVVAIESIPSLQVLYIRRCSVAVLRSMVGVSPSILRLTMVSIEGLTQLHEDVLENLRAVEYLCVRECDELRYLWESTSDACKILVSLYDLKLVSCQQLVSLGEKEVDLGISLKSVNVILYDCPGLLSYDCPNSIEKLVIHDCHSATSLTFPAGHDLPSTMKILDIMSSHNLEVSWLFNSFLSSLEYLSIDEVPNLRSFPEGCLVHLTRLTICGCDNIELIPGNGFGFLPLLCLRYLHINNCKNLKSFPHAHLQSLTSLEELLINDCPSMDYSFPCGLWPPNLSKLVIGGLKKPMSEWGMQNFPTSLVKLYIQGQNSGVVSFATAEDVWNSSNTSSLPFLLPSSLTFLQFRDFMDLESLSEGLRHLICLEELVIWSCPKLMDLPETLLPLLSRLLVISCPKLGKKCRSRKGNYWPIISQIPSLRVHG